MPAVEITYKNADILVAPTQTENVTAFVCCNKATEEKLMNGFDFNGNCCRTAFGFTYYSHNKDQYLEYLNHMKSKGLVINYAAL